MTEGDISDTLEGIDIKRRKRSYLYFVKSLWSRIKMEVYAFREEIRNTAWVISKDPKKVKVSFRFFWIVLVFIIAIPANIISEILISLYATFKINIFIINLVLYIWNFVFLNLTIWLLGVLFSLLLIGVSFDSPRHLYRKTKEHK